MNKNNRHKNYKKQQAAKQKAKKAAYVERKFNTLNEARFETWNAKHPKTPKMTYGDIQSEFTEFKDMEAGPEKVAMIKKAIGVYYSTITMAQFDRFSETFWNNENISSDLRRMIEGNNLGEFLNEIQQSKDTNRTIQFYYALNRVVKSYYGDKESIENFMKKQVYRYVA